MAVLSDPKTGTPTLEVTHESARGSCDSGSCDTGAAPGASAVRSLFPASAWTFLLEKPGHEIRFLVATVAAQLCRLVLAAGNELVRNGVLVTGPGGEFHLAAQLFHPVKNLLVFGDGTDPVLVAVKRPDRHILDLGGIDELLCPLQPSSSRRPRS